MNLVEKVKELENEKYKLLLIVGGPGRGKSKMIREYSGETGIPMLDLDMIFQHTPAENLMNEMKKFLQTYHQPVLLVDNKKVLYAKNNQINMLAFLKEISLAIPVVATWNGRVEENYIHHIVKDADDLVYPLNNEVQIIEC